MLSNMRDEVREVRVVSIMRTAVSEARLEAVLELESWPVARRSFEIDGIA